MINKRIKEGIRKIKRPSKQQIKMSLGTIAVIFSCLLLLIISTFTQIKSEFVIPYSTMDLKLEYIPQIPIVIFISALLGKKWGVFTVLLYIIIGLTNKYPIFALGGGLSYIFEYSFGYIIGFLFGGYICAEELKKTPFALRLITAPLLGILTIHIFGILYMIVIALLRHDSFSFIADLIYYQSLSTILYDFVFSLITVLIAKICRKFLWLITG